MSKKRFMAIAAFLCVISAPAANAACSAYPYTFTNGTTADAGQVNSNFTTVMNCATTPLPVPTRQILTSGSSATYTTPTGVRQLRIRMWGAGGGGGGGGFSSGGGSAGGATIFNSVNAAGGGGGGNGASGDGGIAGTGGTGTASFRRPGQPGGGTLIQANPPYVESVGGGNGGGGGTRRDASAANSTGQGGGGGDTAGTSAYAGGGGGEGEYVELIINSPSSTYTYTIGAGGTGGSAGSGGAAGGNGGSGVIIVDEFY